jgi:glycosyltransferase involved in cell wall biosynthesis
MSISPPVSVCLTTYNRAKLVGGTVETILNQRFGDFELIVSDNASEDDTEAVCREFERRDKRVRYYRNPTNLGMPGNLNAAIRRSSAPLIANLHDGDLYRDDLLQKWKEALEEKPECAFVFNALEFLDAGGRRQAPHPNSFPRRIERGALVEYMLGRFGSPVWGTVMARRWAYDSHGLFNPRYSFIADVEMWMRLNLHHPVAYVPEALITLTPHEPDRPYAFVNWTLERALTSMHEEIIELYFQSDSVRVAEAREQMRRRRDRRWLRMLGACLRRGRLDVAEEGLRVFSHEDSALLRAAGAVWPVLVSLRRVAGAGGGRRGGAGAERRTTRR